MVPINSPAVSIGSAVLVVRIVFRLRGVKRLGSGMLKSSRYVIPIPIQEKYRCKRGVAGLTHASLKSYPPLYIEKERLAWMARNVKRTDGDDLPAHAAFYSY